MVNKDFRLWLTSQPTSAFPVTILQNSVKISVENPNNLKANLLRVWQNNISEEQLNDSIKVDANKLKYKKLVYSLSLFYAVLLQRKKYGSIGFNTPYAWSASDIQICIQQLPTFLDKYLDTYPKQALLYLFAEINIGGCVTDAIDQRTVNAIVEDYLNINVVKDNYMFQSGRVRTDADQNSPEFYQLPGDLSYDAYLEQINELIPQECHPVNIGLNMNSNITADRGECQKLLDGLMDMYTGKLQ